MIYALAIAFVLAGSGQATAGLLGDMVDDLCADCGLGEVVEDAQRQVLQAWLAYRDMEEVIAQGVDKLTSAGFVESAAPLLCVAIRESRDSATRAGTQPIPKEMRDQLDPYFGSKFLRGVEYRIGVEGDLSLQTVFLPFGTTAITLDHVIVFRSGPAAESLWTGAHELGHVKQIERSGLDGFCKDYLRNFLVLEAEADRVADDVVARRPTVAAGS